LTPQSETKSAADEDFHFYSEKTDKKFLEINCGANFSPTEQPFHDLLTLKRKSEVVEGSTKNEINKTEFSKESLEKKSKLAEICTDAKEIKDTCKTFSRKRRLGPSEGAPKFINKKLKIMEDVEIKNDFKSTISENIESCCVDKQTESIPQTPKKNTDFPSCSSGVVESGTSEGESKIKTSLKKNEEQFHQLIPDAKGESSTQSNAEMVGSKLKCKGLKRKSSQDSEVEAKISRKDIDFPQKESLKSNQEIKVSEKDSEIAHSGSNNDNQEVKSFATKIIEGIADFFAWSDEE